MQRGLHYALRLVPYTQLQYVTDEEDANPLVPYLNRIG